MNGGAASYAERAPSDLIVTHEITWTLITKSSNCPSRTVSTRRVLILLPRSNPNQCRANGVKGHEGSKDFWSHPDSGQRLNSTLLHTSEALYVRSFTCVKSDGFLLPHDPVEGGTLQSWRPRSDFEAQVASISRIALQLSRIDSPTATMMMMMMKRMMKINNNNDEDDKKGFVQVSYSYRTGNERFGRTTGSRSDTVVANNFSTAIKLGLHIVTLPIPIIKRSQTARQPDRQTARPATYQLLHIPILLQHFVTTDFLESLQSGIPIPTPKLVLFICTSMALLQLSAVIQNYLLLVLSDPADKNMTQTRMNPLVHTCYLLPRQVAVLFRIRQPKWKGIGRLKPQLQRPDRYNHNHHHNSNPCSSLACLHASSSLSPGSI